LVEVVDALWEDDVVLLVLVLVDFLMNVGDDVDDFLLVDVLDRVDVTVDLIEVVVVVLLVDVEELLLVVVFFSVVTGDEDEDLDVAITLVVLIDVGTAEEVEEEVLVLVVETNPLL